jgi:hypothetical protein
MAITSTDRIRRPARILGQVALLVTLGLLGGCAVYAEPGYYSPGPAYYAPRPVVVSPPVVYYGGRGGYYHRHYR